jgi:hypothetical protein
MATHPYSDAAPYQRWRPAIAQPACQDVDPVIRAKFRIGPQDRIVSAGSCFAQHMARGLKQSGFTYLVTETAHPLLPQAVAEQFGYGIYTARFGNIYTARQLLQLHRRVFGQLRPQDDLWVEGGRYFDPFRPGIQPGGFATRREYELDRARHFAAVRTAFETMDVLVFTLGLTECWAHRGDGCVYPVCPGTVAGRFDPEAHALLNLSVEDTIADMRAFVAELRAYNPVFRLILTVSPVPLAATALDRHVLVSTTYSKSVLRVAAEALAADPAILYFPSYEIITGAFNRGRYWAPDLRAVTEAGVDHVMRLFLTHVTEAPPPPPADPAPMDDHFERQRRAVAVLCEEEALDPS